MVHKTYSVIIPNNVYPLPSSREISAARIIANFLQHDAICVARNDRKTPDFLIGKNYWELKSPTGTGKYNIQHALQAASKQSQYIVIDARFSKKHINKIKSEINYQLKKANNIKRLLLIDKKKNIIELCE